jgi:hypothetical protein
MDIGKFLPPDVEEFEEWSKKEKETIIFSKIPPGCKWFEKITNDAMKCRSW